MKIALFHNLPAGGAKRCVFEHARRLSQRGHTVDAYTTTAANETFCPLESVCHKVRVQQAPPAPAQPTLPPLLRKAVDFATLYRRAVQELERWETLYSAMAREIDSGDYDLVYAHNCRYLQSPYLLRALSTTCVYYCHDSLRALQEWPLDATDEYDTATPGPGRVQWQGHTVPLSTYRVWQERIRRDTRNARSADHILVNSRYSREVMLREYGRDSRVCYPGVDTEQLQPSSAGERERTVIAVGGISPIKRYDFLIEALGTIAGEKRPPLHIYGYDLLSTPDKESPLLTDLRRQAAERGVALEVRRDVSDATLLQAYQRAGVVAFAPHLEPLGLIPLEAMACAAPVVGVAEAGVRETIAHGETGLLTERDPMAFGEAILRLLDDPGLAAGYGAAGRNAVCARWNWESSTDRLEAFFRRVESEK